MTTTYLSIQVNNPFSFLFSFFFSFLPFIHWSVCQFISLPSLGLFFYEIKERTSNTYLSWSWIGSLSSVFWPKVLCTKNCAKSTDPSHNLSPPKWFDNAFLYIKLCSLFSCCCISNNIPSYTPGTMSVAAIMSERWPMAVFAIRIFSDQEISTNLGIALFPPPPKWIYNIIIKVLQTGGTLPGRTKRKDMPSSSRQSKSTASFISSNTTLVAGIFISSQTSSLASRNWFSFDSVLKLNENGISSGKREIRKARMREWPKPNKQTKNSLSAIVKMASARKCVWSLVKNHNLLSFRRQLSFALSFYEIQSIWTLN